MLNKLGRNDLCWCGSQKNIKNAILHLIKELNFIKHMDT